jgi:signal transduction histidine kinase
VLTLRIRPPRAAADLWTPWAGDDDSRAECLIAIVRAALASSALLIAWFESTEPAIYALRVLLLLKLYTGFAAVALLLIIAALRAPAWARVVILIADLSLAVALTSLTRGPASPFSAFLLFAVISAAWRWGSRETLITTAVVIAAIAVETLLVGTATRLSLGFLQGSFDLGRPIAGVIYVLIVGVLLAALSEKEQQRRKEVSTIASLLEQAGTAAGMEGPLEAVLGAVGRAFAAEHAVLVLTQTSTGRAFRWNAAVAPAAGEPILATSELDDRQRACYFFDAPGAVWHALRLRASDWFDAAALDASGNRVTAGAFTLPAPLLAAYRCDSAIGISIGFGKEWTGRLLLMDPAIGSDRQSALHLAHRLSRQIGPAAHHGYLLGTLKARAAGAERARLARELHDGVVQSLIVAEIQVEIIRRRSAADAPQLADALAHVQTLLRTEIGDLRELTHRLKTPDSGVPPLPGLTEVVTRFERDTGIEARLCADAGAAALSQSFTDEICHILQEGLVNVRKHSGARHVLVRAGAANGRVRLSIEDDGRGFPFSGRRSQMELAALHQGPAVIMERVRELGGEMAVESTPGLGARVVVAVPLQP